MRGMVHGHLGLRVVGGGPLGLPADFLIAPSGRINAVNTAPTPTTSGPSMSCSVSRSVLPRDQKSLNNPAPRNTG